MIRQVLIIVFSFLFAFQHAAAAQTELITPKPDFGQLWS